MTSKMTDIFMEAAEHYSVRQVSDGEITRIRFADKCRAMTVWAEFCEYIDRELLFKAEHDIRESYGFSSVMIRPRFPEKCFNKSVLDDMIMELKRRISTVNGSFTNCKWTWDSANGVVECELAHNALALLAEKHFSDEFVNLVREEFGKNVEIRLSFDRSAARVVPVPTPPPQAVSAPPPKPSGDPPPWEAMPEQPVPDRPEFTGEARLKKVKVQQGPAHLTFEGIPDPYYDPEVIHGTPKSIPAVAMANLNPNYKKVTVYGSIFSFSVKDTKAGDKKIISFAVTDKTSSVTVKMIAKNEDCGFLGSLRDGQCVAVQGEYKFDDFDHEFSIRPQCIATMKQTKRTDNAQVKRVELHMHTNMSAMDAMTPTKKLVQRAADWGMTAIAITDHGVAQAFPDAMNAAKACKKDGKPIKILYGIEAYYIDDMVDIVKGEDDRPIDGEFIVFDLETTGLSAASERITEIGAVRYRGGEILDQFNSFVNPHMPIPPKIVELTGITDEMVKDAPDENQAVRSFLQFCGENPVFIAHNANFDIGFMKAACERCGIAFDPVYIDTVPLARALHPALKNHKLDTVGEYLEIPPFEHHRACDDALALAQIVQKEFELLAKEYEVRGVKDINTKAKSTDTTKLRPNHMIIIAQNLVGLKNLYKLISASNLKHFHRKPRIPRSEIIKRREGLIIGSACEQGELYQAILLGRSEKDIEKIASFYDYLEVQAKAR